MMKAFSQIKGIVLAGGRSSRFGQDKGSYPFKGKPLVEHALEILRPNIPNMAISTNQTELYAYLGLPMFADVYPDCGPLGGIHSALCLVAVSVQEGDVETKHALSPELREGEGAIAVISCDTPHVPSELYAWMTKHLYGYDAVIPVHAGFKETTCALYTTACLPVFEQAIKEKRYKILDALSDAKVRYLDVSTAAFYKPGIFHNINYLGDVDGVEDYQ